MLFVFKTIHNHNMFDDDHDRDNGNGLLATYDQQSFIYKACAELNNRSNNRASQ